MVDLYHAFAAPVCCAIKFSNALYYFEFHRSIFPAVQFRGYTDKHAAVFPCRESIAVAISYEHNIARSGLLPCLLCDQIQQRFVLF
jgi:hypothetical protein